MCVLCLFLCVCVCVVCTCCKFSSCICVHINSFVTGTTFVTNTYILFTHAYTWFYTGEPSDTFMVYALQILHKAQQEGISAFQQAPSKACPNLREPTIPPPMQCNQSISSDTSSQTSDRKTVRIALKVDVGNQTHVNVCSTQGIKSCNGNAETSTQEIKSCNRNAETVRKDAGTANSLNTHVSQSDDACSDAKSSASTKCGSDVGSSTSLSGAEALTNSASGHMEDTSYVADSTINININVAKNVSDAAGHVEDVAVHASHGAVPLSNQDSESSQQVDANKDANTRQDEHGSTQHVSPGDVSARARAEGNDCEEMTGAAIEEQVKEYLELHDIAGIVSIKWLDKSTCSVPSMRTRCDPLAGDNAVSGTLHLVKNARMSRAKLRSLLDHEIGTHFLRAYNQHVRGCLPGLRSEVARAVKGSESMTPVAESLETEEGLATINTHLTAACKTLWSPAVSYYAQSRARDLGFTQLFLELRQYIPSAASRWSFCMRSKRGLRDASLCGAMAKDRVYFEGAIKILLRRNVLDFRVLHSGKVRACMFDVDNVGISILRLM
jgi:hypothetical protein